MQINYTAKRSIQAGHTLDTEYTINVDLMESDRRSGAEGAQHIALDGTTVTTVHSERIREAITTVHIDSSTTPTILDMREFLDSVKYSETFTMDVSGALKTYVLDSFRTPYTERRVHPNRFVYSFTARQL